MSEELQTFTGILKAELVNPGSKSEGRAAWLEIPMEEEPLLLRLYRKDRTDVDDPMFAGLDGQLVTVQGKREVGDYLCVEEMTVNNDATNNNDNNE